MKNKKKGTWISK